MYGYGQTVQTESTVCPGLLINHSLLDQVSAHNDFGLLRRFRGGGLERLISDLFNPLFVPPAVIGILAWMLGLSGLTIGWILATALLFYTVIPLGGTFYLLNTKKIVSIDLPEQKSRTGLYILGVGSAFAAFVVFRLMHSYTHALISVVALVYFLNAASGLFINLKWKMSIHSAGISSSAAIFLFYSEFQGQPLIPNGDILSLIILLLLLPLMFWSRYRLNIHSPGELLGGASTGFLLTLLELSILTNLW